MNRMLIGVAVAAAMTASTVAQEARPMSPRGTAATQIGGQWVKPAGRGDFTLGGQTYTRLVSNSEAVRARIGAPRQVAYGPTEIEKLDIFRTDRAKAASKTSSRKVGPWLSKIAAR